VDGRLRIPFSQEHQSECVEQTYTENLEGIELLVRTKRNREQHTKGGLIVTKSHTTLDLCIS